MSVHETTEDGESLLSLACSAGYYELAQVRLCFASNFFFGEIAQKWPLELYRSGGLLRRIMRL